MGVQALNSQWRASQYSLWNKEQPIAFTELPENRCLGTHEMLSLKVFMEFFKLLAITEGCRYLAGPVPSL